MIPDSQTNRLFLADTLPLFYPEFYMQLKTLLDNNKIDFKLIPDTKDIWAVDYMPIQIDENNFIQFKYNPDYLKKAPDNSTISDVDMICNKMKLQREKSDLTIDGGNVIRSSNTLVMCDKVFYENKSISKKQLTSELQTIFNFDKIIFIPWDKNDFTGHADGMVRFLDNDTVLINQPTGENPDCEKELRAILKKEGLNCIELPYLPPPDPTFMSAKGLYLNYLQMSHVVIVPVFNTDTDDMAVQLFEELFKRQTVLAIDCNDIAKEGGVLNCISWNIKADG